GAIHLANRGQRRLLTQPCGAHLLVDAESTGILVPVTVLFVVDRAQQWPFEIPGSSVVTARAYLTEAAYATGMDAQVLNLCRVDRYQWRGYYVSLLAEARDHRPVPDVKAINGLQSDEHVKTLATQFGELTRESIRHEGTDRFELDAYFGRDPA